MYIQMLAEITPTVQEELPRAKALGNKVVGIFITSLCSSSLHKPVIKQIADYSFQNNLNVSP